MSREWALYGQVGGKRSWCKCKVVPVISNRGSQWGSATDSYESGSAASNGVVLLFGNAYYKCHLSALPGTLPSLRHVNRDCSVPCFMPQPCFLPTVLGERRDSVISTCASSGSTWRISTGWLMLGLFNISEFTFCKLSFSSRSAYLPTHTVTISSCSRPRCLAILAFSNSVGKWTTCPLNSVSHTNIACKKN